MVKIDLSYLEVLSEDDDDFKKEFIQTFEETFVSLVAKMREELANGDLTNLGKSAHQLKPSAKMIQLPCGDVLEDWQHNPANATKEGLEKVNQECEEALQLLNEWAG